MQVLGRQSVHESISTVHWHVAWKIDSRYGQARYGNRKHGIVNCITIPDIGRTRPKLWSDVEIDAGTVICRRVLIRRFLQSPHPNIPTEFTDDLGDCVTHAQGSGSSLEPIKAIP